MNATKDIWAEIMEMLSSKLTSTSIKTWFSDCQPVALADGCLVIHTPTPFKRDIIQQRFSETIRAALKELFSCDFELTVLAGDELESYLKKTAEKTEAGSASDFEEEYTFDTFIVGASNRFAHGAALGVVQNPGRRAYNPLFIYGNSGLGKTHLLMAIRNAVHAKLPNAKILYIRGETFLNEMVYSLKNGVIDEFRQKYRYVDMFLMDDIHFVAGKESTQEEFFHTFNTLYESGHQIVLTSDRPPMDMPLLDDRLRTRFEGGLMADIQPPDIELRMAIIRDKAGHLGLLLRDDIVSYIGEKLTSNIRQIEGVVKQLTAIHEVEGIEIDRPAVDRAIKNVVRMGTYIPTPEDIIRETAGYYQVSVEDIKGKRRNKEIAMARHMSIYLIRDITNLSLEETGKFVGSRNHTTVLSSIRNIERLKESNPETVAAIRDITSYLEAHHER